MEETLEREPVNCLRVTFDPERARRSAAEVHQQLRDGNPRILVHLTDGALIVAVDAMAPGAEQVVARRLKECLAG
jgi:hypothetical protein